LKSGEEVIADGYSEVTILFADIVGFTSLASSVNPTELLGHLNRVFSTFDQLTEEYGLEKIKTIGDNYMVVGGLPIPSSNHASKTAEMALSIQRAMPEINEHFKKPMNIRIGMHTGSVVAGVIGRKKFAYDIWGDAVNTASRMESYGIPGKIQTSEATYQLLNDQFQFEERGMVDMKGKGILKTYFLKGRKPQKG
jgi:class 3 adenylate cyclase